MEQVVSRLDEPKQLHDYILEKIAAHRAYWQSKPGLKRLAVHPKFG